MINAVETLRVLGQSTPSQAEAAEKSARELVRRGMPASVIDRLADAFDMGIGEVQRIIGVSPATGTRRRANRAPLRREESDRAFRMANAYALASKVLEDERRARQWFKQPNPALHGERPLDLLDTDVGTQQVIRILNRIELGIYS